MGSFGSAWTRSKCLTAPSINHKIELNDEETTALSRELDQIIDADKYVLSPRIRTLKAIRAKLRPESVCERLPPQRQCEPPRFIRGAHPPRDEPAPATSSSEGR
jgi:hypothetical protein